MDIHLAGFTASFLFSFPFFFFSFCFFCLFLRWSFSLLAQAGVNSAMCNRSSLQPSPPGFKPFSCLSFPGCYYRCASPHPANFCIILVEMEFHHVGQAGHKLLNSSGPPPSPSQSAATAGVSHCTQPAVVVFSFFLFYSFPKKMLETGINQ